MFVAESEQQALVEEDFGDGGLDGNGAALRYSKRKFFALVNFLRVLQKLAKYNHHRCLLLIKFSAPVCPLPSCFLFRVCGAVCAVAVARACAIVLIGGGNRQAILKRLLSFENPWIRLYGLKLIKNLTKFLGRKWRTSTHSILFSLSLSPLAQVCYEGSC